MGVAQPVHGEICHWARVAVLLSGEGYGKGGLKKYERRWGRGKFRENELYSGVVDGHCYLDRMLQESRVSGVSYMGLTVWGNGGGWLKV